MTGFHLTMIALSALALPAPAAFADGRADAAFQVKVLGRPIEQTDLRACFSRAYGAAHLATHRLQNVTSMLLLVTARPDQGGRAFYEISLGATFRSSPSFFAVDGGCVARQAGAHAEESTIRCQEGAIDVSSKSSGSILVAIRKGAQVALGDRAAGGVARTGLFGADDMVFALETVALTECLPLAEGDAARALMLKAP